MLSVLRSNCTRRQQAWQEHRKTCWSPANVMTAVLFINPTLQTLQGLEKAYTRRRGCVSAWRRHSRGRYCARPYHPA